MPVKSSFIIIICKLVIFSAMVYNVFLSPVWIQYNRLADEQQAPSQPLDWLPWKPNSNYHNNNNNGEEKLPSLDYLNPINSSARQHIDYTTIHKCTNTSTEPAFDICIYAVQRDKYISGSLLSQGVWEPHITKLFTKVLDIYADNLTVIDIGANIGYYSLLSASRGHRVLAVEPSIQNIAHILKAIQIGERDADTPARRRTGRITILHNAVLDSHQQVTLTSNPDNQGGLWIELPGSRTQTNTTSPLIKTILMDDLQTLLCRNHSILIKVDIEGFECRAMTSAGRLLRTYHVPYVFMEWGKMFRGRHRSHTPCPVGVIRKMTALLTGLHYTAVEVRTGFLLDPDRATTKWRIGDVYWKHQSAPQLQQPY